MATTPQMALLRSGPVGRHEHVDGQRLVPGIATIGAQSREPSRLAVST
jgi:hypothetical protein